MKTMNCLALLSALLLTTSVAMPAEKVENQGQLSATDFKFAGEAARIDLMEAKAGELARAQGSDPLVRQYGERMVVDHTKSGAEVQSAAAARGATLRVELTAKQQRDLDRLRKLNGEAFDKAYVRYILDEHKREQEEFQKAAQSADDADLRAYANRTVALIAQHYDQAREVSASVYGISENPTGQ